MGIVILVLSDKYTSIIFIAVGIQPISVMITEILQWKYRRSEISIVV